jgi:mycoredoxin
MHSPMPERYPVTAPEVSLAPVMVYGTTWCAATQLIRRHLERLGIPYRYLDIERDARAAAQVRWWNGGQMVHPVVAIGSSILVEPSLEELDWALADVGLV